MKDILDKFRKASLVIFALLIVCAAAMGSGIDTAFTPQIQTDIYASKSVGGIVSLPDGRLMATGEFNTYNGVSVGRLIRLNADGSLDATFNNDIVTSGSPGVIPMPDGRLLLRGTMTLSDGTAVTEKFVMLTPDGERDPSFQYTLAGPVFDVKIDASGRIVLSCDIAINENGVMVVKRILRLLPNGALDPSFTPVPPPGETMIALQGNKIIYGLHDGAANVILWLRLNEDGSRDMSYGWTVFPWVMMREVQTLPDNRFVLMENGKLFRFNADGGIDTTFQPPVFPAQIRRILLQPDGRITIVYPTSSPWGVKVLRLLPNGSPDPSFAQYQHTISRPTSCALQPDGRVVIGDEGSSLANGFTRLLSDGNPDTSFNQNGVGFQMIAPGKVRSVTTLPDGKILIGGLFNKVNGVTTQKLARLNNDGSVDQTFGVNTTPTGNYFSQLGEVLHVLPQADGRIVVSGSFEYRLSGVTKRNLVRLDPNGQIDPTFNLTATIPDLFGPSGGNSSTNKLVQRPDGKIYVGTTGGGSASVSSPTLIDINGAKDTSYNPVPFPGADTAAHDMSLMADGKLLISGRYAIPNVNGGIERGFVARLNADGSTDTSFQKYESADIFAVARLAYLESGKILIVRWTNTAASVARLNATGTPDATFYSGSGANGRIQSINLMPNGQILVAGSFTTYDGQPRQNLALLNADGTLAGRPGKTNGGVLTTFFDSGGRLLAGGEFTRAFSGSQQANVSYLVRFNSLSSTPRTTPFDYDGDGRSDVSVYRPSEGIWYLQNSTAGFGAVRFGVTADRIVPADYDGDGKTDVAVFRPADGAWHVINSSTGTPSTRLFGNSEDVPVPADYDGDGKADISVFRASQGVWYRQNSSDQTMVSFGFGQAGDVPAVGDYDGDGKADIAVWRPSEGVWYYLRSSDGEAAAQRFGQQGDSVVPADFDGDGTTDIAVYRPSAGTCYFRNSSNGTYRAITLGNAADIPAPADYDGDGKADASVFRSADGTWHRQNSSSGAFTTVQWGMNGDTPTPGR